MDFEKKIGFYDLLSSEKPFDYLKEPILKESQTYNMVEDEEKVMKKKMIKKTTDGKKLRFRKKFGDFFSTVQVASRVLLAM